ncbi:SDR family NAD(P)-dependent oxidoreductase [Paracoccus marcusii]|uniref:SDR family NAD(P)-dependent oxidoreductase n=1 Tax=Paracoccus marcusii TaxID=59779 RepID=UPI0035A5970D
MSMDRFRLDGRVALVTGASGALGAEFARGLAGAGARVVLAARRVEAMQVLARQLTDAHVTALDVTDPGSVARAVADAEAWAGAPVDLLVNNSGIAIPGASLEQSDQDWARVMGVNLDGARRMSVAVAARLVEAGRPGAIVNVASILGLRQGAGVSAYATSKAALIQLTKQHALEWARHGIRVNALAPGYVETDINRDFFATDHGQAQIRRIPQRRLGQAGDLAGPLLLLASDAGAFMTGSVLVADGGHLLSPL